MQPCTPTWAPIRHGREDGLTYWGQVPVRVTIGGTEFTTALFPKDGRYLVPVKAAVQRAEAIAEGAIVQLVLRLNAAR
jgi:hypothetical protein